MSAVEYLVEKTLAEVDAGLGIDAPDDDTPEPWAKPIPLVEKIEPAPYPIDALPVSVRNAIKEVHAFVKAPVALVASSAMGAMSLAIQANADVKRAEKLQGPVSIYVLVIADSGERKSTCDGLFMDAIKDYELRQAEAARSPIRDYNAAMEAWNAKRNGIKEKIKQLAKAGRPAHEQEEALRELEHDKPDPPKVARLIYMDATPEALRWNLAKTWPSGGVVSSEAGLVLGGHGMGAESVLRNLATLNQLWEGASIATERRTSESFIVRGARLTIALQVQEPALRAFFDRSGDLARGTGFLARFLIAWPASTQGHRPFSEPPKSWPALAQFNRRISEILEDVSLDEDGTLSPHVIPLSAEAKAAWVRFHDAIESELGSGGELCDVRDVASKAADNAARIAAIFHVFEHGPVGSIGVESFDRAARIAAWHLNESRRFYGALALRGELNDAVALDEWLIAYCRNHGTLAVPRREVQRNVSPARLRRKSTLDHALAELVDADRVQLVHVGKRKEIRVNPTLLGGHAR